MRHEDDLYDFNFPILTTNEEQSLVIDDDEVVVDITSSVKATSDGKRSQATLLVELALGCVDLFHVQGDPDQPFARFTVDRHVETWPIRGMGFKSWLAASFFEAYDKAAGSGAINDAVNVLAGKARMERRSLPMFTRLGAFDGKIYVDLANAEWEVVEVDADGWRVLPAPPAGMAFRRVRGMLPLLYPVPGGDLSTLRNYVNVEPADWPLVAGVLVMMFNPSGPYPVLALLGEQGSGKTSVARAIKSIVDPDATGSRSTPREMRDLAIAATNGWVIAYDNISSIPDWLSDGLCRVSTGVGFGTRQLYTDDEEKLFAAKRPVILNGITDVISRGDLLDRSVLVRLPAIDEDERRDEKRLWSAFDRDRPLLLGALLDAVSTAIGSIDSVNLDRLPRMADFARWVVACEPALGLESGEFMAAYDNVRKESHVLAIEGEIVGRPLLEFLEAVGYEWEGSPGELLSKLNEAPSNEALSHHRDWPRVPRGIVGRVQRIAPHLRAQGVDFYRPARTARTWPMGFGKIGS